MGNDNRGILEALGVRPTMLEECLHQVAILGCRFSCDMLKAFWHNRPATVEQSPDAPTFKSVSTCFACILWDGHSEGWSFQKASSDICLGPWGC